METIYTSSAEHATRQDRRQYFQHAYDGFCRAEQAGAERVTRDFQIAGKTIRLRMAGRALVPYITRTLAHLGVSEAPEADLTICMWDSASTATPPPLLIAAHLAYTRHYTWQLIDSRFQMLGLYGERFRCTFHNGPNILSVLDMQENLAVYWTPDATQTPYYESSYPIKQILSAWFQSQGLQYVHAAAVGLDDGGILIPGRGGAGKSSTALACIGSRIGFLGDDYCLVQFGSQPRAFSLYNAAKLKTMVDVDRFPHLMPMISNLDRVDQEMAMIFTHEHWPEMVMRDFPLKAIMVPKIMDRRQTRIAKTSRATAIKALLPTIKQLPGTGQEAYQTISALSHQLPCYQLELGSDIADIPKAIHSFLAA